MTGAHQEAFLPPRCLDLSLLQMASHYDLSQKSERRRSARDLAGFFLRAAKVVEADLFIEVGAKEASASHRARSYLPQSRVVAFEANPYTFEKFQGENPESTGVEYYHLAVSDRPGPVTFHVRLHPEGSPRPDGHGSLLERDDSYEHDFDEVTVDSTTLDIFFAYEEFKRCAMWVDVEGASEAVLSGGRSVLSKAAIVIIEVEDRALWKGSWTAPEVTRCLAEVGLFPVARDFEYAYQYNVVFVRESLLNDPLLRLRLAQHFSARTAASQANGADTQGISGGRKRGLLRRTMKWPRQQMQRTLRAH